jgi:hypothetical protein
MLVRQILILHAFSRSTTTFLARSWLLVPSSASRTTTTSRRSLLAVASPTGVARLFSSKRSSSFYDRADNVGRSTEEEEQDATNRSSSSSRTVEDYFPDTFRKGVEMDVRVMRVVNPDYVLVRPIQYPRIKGKISNAEISELEEGYNATAMIAENDVYTAVVTALRPPDKAIFSLRRVRRVLRDDFQPFTVAFFNVHPEMSEHQLKNLLEEEHGKVLDVDNKNNEFDDFPDRPIFVVFLHQADGMAAIKKWNKTPMPCSVDEEDGKTLYRRVRCKKSHHQTHREKLQNYLDFQLRERNAEWDETPSDRRAKERAMESLYDIIPWYYIDQETERQTSWMGRRYLLYPEYTVKNNARKAGLPGQQEPPDNIM